MLGLPPREMFGDGGETGENEDDLRRRRNAKTNSGDELRRYAK